MTRKMLALGRWVTTLESSRSDGGVADGESDAHQGGGGCDRQTDLPRRDGGPADPPPTPGRLDLSQGQGRAGRDRRSVRAARGRGGDRPALRTGRRAADDLARRREGPAA